MVKYSLKLDPVELSRLVSLAYEAPFLTSGWRDFTTAAASVLQARLAMMHHMDYAEQARSLHIAGGIDESFSLAFSPRWSEDGDDIYLREMLHQPAGVIRLSSDIVAPALAHQTEIHQQLAKPWDLEYFLFASLGSRDGVSSVLSLGRATDDEPFGTDDVDLLGKVLLPHLCRSISVHASLAGIRQNNALLALMIDMAPLGIVAFDATGKPILVSQSAADLFARDGGLAMRNGKLRATSSTAQALLDTALLHAITLHKDLSSAPPAPVQVPRKGQGHPYQVLFSPISQRTESVDLPRRAACIALIYDQQPIQHADLSTALIQAYGLSKAEARVCKALLSGKSAQEAAVALNISRNTVKTHLARIFHKTGVHSQTALLQLMTARWKAGA